MRAQQTSTIANTKNNLAKATTINPPSGIRPVRFVTRFTDGRVPNPNIQSLFSEEHRWQRWLDVEAALANAEAEAGVIPVAAATAITQAAQLDNLDIDHIRERILVTSHSLMAMVNELNNAVGDTYGGWVHWGATTQNITQTGDMLVLRDVHNAILNFLGQILDTLATLAEKSADMVCAGRTHGQQAVPITFGLKVATWIDEISRHVERLREVEKRVFTAMVGGAVGNFGSLGLQGPIVQEGVAKRLGLQSIPIPSRAINDSMAEYVCILGLLAGSGGKIANEIYTLMKTEYGEVEEPAPEGTIGSSTMPHKRNPQLSDECMAMSAEIRSLVPLALEGMINEHEVRDANSLMAYSALQRSCITTGDMLTRLLVILSGLKLNEKRMRANLDLTHGLINSEAVMLALGSAIGRQQAHEIIYETAQRVSRTGEDFAELLCSDKRVTDYLDQSIISQLLDPITKTGLSVTIAQASAKKARKLTRSLHTASSVKL